MQYNICVVWTMVRDMRSVNMRNLEAATGVGEELQAMTKATGAALVRFGEQTFVVVEVEREPVQVPAETYCATDPEEIEALRDAMDDQDNPSYTTAEALAYLRSLREKRAEHGGS
jgi:hypothetical protein